MVLECSHMTHNYMQMLLTMSGLPVFASVSVGHASIVLTPAYFSMQCVPVSFSFMITVCFDLRIMTLRANARDQCSRLIERCGNLLCMV